MKTGIANKAAAFTFHIFHLPKPWRRPAYFIFFSLFLGCAPLYVKNLRYETLVREGDFQSAESFVEKDRYFKQRRNRLLYLLEKGKLAHLQERYAESNDYFNEADRLIEDYYKEFGLEILSLFTSSEVKPYQAEDFESVTIHYYKAMNYLSLGQRDAALVEARRINLQLQALNDRYVQHKNRYADDAFAHIVMGLLYEAAGELNDAFIAYRNAVDLFLDDNGKTRTYFGAALPDQLKQDLLRTAHRNGFQQELHHYEQLFGMTFQPTVPPPGGEAVIFWENGLGPVKDEWSLNFAVVREGKDKFFFVNELYGLRVPAVIHTDDDREGLAALEIFRVALPRYLERPPFYVYAYVEQDGEAYPLEMVEDYGLIARRSLEDRFFREASTALVRLAVKKFSEHQLRKESEGLGALLGAVNALTEKADTRNWQTLPAFLHYTRVPLREGTNELTLQLETCNNQLVERSLTLEGRPGLQFRLFHTVASQPTPPVRVERGF